MKQSLCLASTLILSYMLISGSYSQGIGDARIAGIDVSMEGTYDLDVPPGHSVKVRDILCLIRGDQNLGELMVISTNGNHAKAVSLRNLKAKPNRGDILVASRHAENPAQNKSQPVDGQAAIDALRKRLDASEREEKLAREKAYKVYRPAAEAALEELERMQSTLSASTVYAAYLQSLGNLTYSLRKANSAWGGRDNTPKSLEEIREAWSQYYNAGQNWGDYLEGRTPRLEIQSYWAEASKHVRSAFEAFRNND